MNAARQTLGRFKSVSQNETRDAANRASKRRKSQLFTNGPSEHVNDKGLAAEELEVLARWMDSAFEIPGLRIRFGLDALLGLLPGVGDLTASLASIYILNAAHKHGASRITLARMTLNIAVDLLVGAIPIVGDVFDLYWKSNHRNVRLVHRHLVASSIDARKLRMADRLFVAALIGLVGVLTIGSIGLGYLALSWLASTLDLVAE